MTHSGGRAAGEARVLYRRQPWSFVDELVLDRRPDGYEIDKLGNHSGADALRAELPVCDALLGAWVRDWPLHDDDLQAAPNLRLIQLMSAGFDGVDLDAARRAGVAVATIGDSNADTVAEHALLLILATLRRLPAQDALVRAGGWRPAPPVYEARGKTLGILGAGHTARALAHMVRGLQVRATYWSRTRLDCDTEAALGLTYTPWEQLWSHSDIVSVHLALTPHTRHLVGRGELSLMKSSAILVNTSRGAIVDEAALTDALRERSIAGAGLDVLAAEPPHSDCPLLTLDNVVLTPHLAGLSPDAWPRIVAQCWENITRALTGRPIRHRVG